MPTAPLPLRDVPEDLSRLFDRASSLGRAPLRQDVLDAVAVLAESWTAAEVEAELRRSGNLEALLEGSAGQQVFAALGEEIRDSYEGPRQAGGRRLDAHRAPLVNVYVSASDAVTVTSPIRETWWSTDRWVQSAVDWTESIGAQRITGITEGTKAGIRALLAEAFEAGADRDWIARAMVALDGDGSLRLGLDAPRSRTFQRFVEELDPSIPAARRQRLIDRRYRQLLRARADTIAQTEVVDVGNAAQMDTYQAAELEGELDSRIYVIEWVARTIACKRCLAMDGATREINSGQFVSDGSGPKGVESVARPELHVRGWCFSRIIRRSAARRQPTP